jgi:hypothetical protein
MSEAPDYATAIPNLASIHTMPTLPGEAGQIGLTQDQLETFVKNLIEGIVREVVLDVVGVLLPGPAAQQLANWAGDIVDQFFNIGSLFNGVDLSSGSLNLSDVWTGVINVFLNPLNLIELGGQSLTNLASLLGININQSTGTFDPIDALVVAPVQGVLTLLDNMFNATATTTGTGHTQDEVATALTGQTDTVAGTASTLAQVVAGFGAGTPDADDFERTSSVNLGANWMNLFSSGTGPLATPNGHDAHYGGSAEYLSIKTDIQASTDHQIVSVILAQAIPAWGFFTPIPFGGYNDIWLRCTNFTTWATRTGIRLRINSAAYAAGYNLSWFNAGTETILASNSMPSVPGTGAVISLEAGAGGTNLRFVASLNGSPFMDFTDTGTSSFGASYLYRGMGGNTGTGGGPIQGSADLKGWTAQG